jgi:hypothetical protein
MRRSISRAHAGLIAVLLALVCLGAAAAVALAAPLPGEDDFDIARWELRHLPNKWLYLIGRPLREPLSKEREDARLARFLELSGRIRRLEQRASDAGSKQAELTELRRQRGELENDVEALIEGRLTTVLAEAGLASSLPLFPDARWVFPPVDVEFDEPPQVLSVSPRDRIELIERRPLRPDLPLRAVIELEQAVERDGRRSALVEPIAGAATYPSIVEPRSSYEGLLEVVAHEWVHQYLFFQPLGRRFYDSLELRTLNETVATLAGQELAVLVVLRYPLPSELAPEPPSAPAPVDIGEVLHQLRTDVDALLAFGQVAEAEALMARRQEQLADLGFVYRRINQAFFASRSVYASDPASTDPIGDKVRELRRRAGSLGAFIRAAEGLTSESDLDRELAEAP